MAVPAWGTYRGGDGLGGLGGAAEPAESEGDLPADRVPVAILSRRPRELRGPPLDDGLPMAGQDRSGIAGLVGLRAVLGRRSVRRTGRALAGRGGRPDRAA